MRTSIGACYLLQALLATNGYHGRRRLRVTVGPVLFFRIRLRTRVRVSGVLQAAFACSACRSRVQARQPSRISVTLSPGDPICVTQNT